jgi:glutamyl-tRNA reductase
MTIKCGRRLAQEGVDLVIANRSPERARALADELRELGTGKVVTLPLAELGGPETLGGLSAAVVHHTALIPAVPAALIPAVPAALICATAAPAAVLDRERLARLRSVADDGTVSPLIVDLAVPGDVREDDAAALGLRRLTMDNVIEQANQSRHRKSAELGAAETLLRELVDEHRRKEAERRLAPVLRELQSLYLETVDAALDQMLDIIFGDAPAQLSLEQRESLRRVRETLARRLAHVPTIGLRALATNLRNEGLVAFLEATGLGLPEPASALDVRPAERQQKPSV